MYEISIFNVFQKYFNISFVFHKYFILNFAQDSSIYTASYYAYSLFNFMGPFIAS